MKKTNKKISFKKESLVKLTDNQMKNINAAGTTDWWSRFYCPSTKGSTCPASADLYCNTRTVC